MKNKGKIVWQSTCHSMWARSTSHIREASLDFGR
jgi:hypothetical protein